jgi:hypothetical protein
MANLIWEFDGDAYLATIETAPGRIRFRLVVERSNGSWDWSVWNPRSPDISARHGVADTAQEAMKAAEAAAGP